MENNVKNLENNYKDIIELVNTKNILETQYKKQDYSNVLYKVRIYSFKNGVSPYCIEDDKFENVLNLMGSLLVTVVDSNHVREVKTGKIIPIVHLIKDNDYWNSSIIMSDHLTDNDVLFTISHNKMLFPEQMDIRDLNTYLGMENKNMEEIFNKWQTYNKKYTKNKKI